MARFYYPSYGKALAEYFEPDTNLDVLFELLIFSACTETERATCRSNLGSTPPSAYRTGRRDIPEDLRFPFKRPNARDHLLPYFQQEITAHIPAERIADLIRDLCHIIRNDSSIARKQKNSFLALAKKESINEFLAETFLYAVKQDCRVSESPPETAFPFNNLPFEHNPYFEGRASLLDQIHDQFSEGNAIQAVTGLGGVGKTQIALEYAYRYAEEYDVVWWLDADKPQLLLNDADRPHSLYMAASEFIQRKGLPHCEGSAVSGEFAAWFEQHDNWLLIFDNFDNPSDLEIIRQFMPKSRTGNILFTTRLEHPPTSGAVITPLDVFDESEAVAFLKRRTGLDGEVCAAKLAHRLGYLPLALEQAGAYIAINKHIGETYAE